MTNFNLIELKTLNKKVTQDSETYKVNVTEIKQQLLPALSKILIDKDFKTMRFLDELKSYHDLSTKDILSENLDDNSIWIDPNFLVYMLKNKFELPNEELNLIKHDICVVADKILWQDKLYVSIDFMSSITNTSKEVLLDNINDKLQEGRNTYVNFLSVKDYVAYKYKECKDETNIQALSKLYVFIFLHSFKAYNKSSSLLAKTNITVESDTLDAFADKGTLFKVRDIPFLEDKPKKKKIKRQIGEERVYQCLAQQKYGGQLEVTTPVGRIDLLTETEIYEFKRYKNWKEAVGQLMSYGQSYPNHNKVMMLFDKTDPSNDAEILEVCDALNIEVQYTDKLLA